MTRRARLSHACATTATRGAGAPRLCLLAAVLAHVSACKAVTSRCGADQCRIGAQCYDRNTALHASRCYRCVPETSRSEPTLVLDDACDRDRLAQLCDRASPPDADGDGLCDGTDPCPLSSLNDANDDGECDTEPSGQCDGERSRLAWYPDCDADGVPSAVPVRVCGAEAEANAAFDCADAQDPDGGWSATAGRDCDDEDASSTVEGLWYPDCDGDGAYGSLPSAGCGSAGAAAMFRCADGDAPDGGWSSAAGSDCNDEDAAAVTVTRWYPDCDGDGLPSPTATDACGETSADAALPCADGRAPEGGWSGTAGRDCNDEDATQTGGRALYPDCDGDRAYSVAGLVACSTAGADAVFDCQDGDDPDGGWSPLAGTDCNDEDAASTAAALWFADCDGDGAHSSEAVMACGTSGADEAFGCQDGQDPDGGWAAVAGNDCNDEDASSTVTSPWHADCDGDGAHRSSGILACGEAAADAVFDCADGQAPDGGWSSAAGTDCDDEDASGVAIAPWYADCDGDGAHRSSGMLACGEAGADAVFDCADGQDPDGGWGFAAGTDCDDEDASGVAVAPWHADCDGDGTPGSTGILACGAAGADAAFDCDDGQDPDGRWSAAAGTDCDDEDAAVGAAALWYPDCDGDGVHSAVGTAACDTAGADAAFRCADGRSPDGGWSATAGHDCVDENAAVGAARLWYPDCDDDEAHSGSGTMACGAAGASAAFDCADGQNPDGGWSDAAGDDCGDEDPRATTARLWYPDCDGDGAPSSDGTMECGTLGADAAFDCADGQDPDGGWAASAGSDCDDEDPAGASDGPWYPDCDCDGVLSSAGIAACGAAGADAVFDCGDGEDPDCGWSAAAGTDCDDEDAVVSAAALWYPDCDRDGIFDSAGTVGCGIAGANGAFDCADEQDPDGGWAASAGTDCDDEDGGVLAGQAWYPDCDADNEFSTAVVVVCGAATANAVFECQDGHDPDGGWSATAGSDCNDEDPALAAEAPWYPDCDGDGAYHDLAKWACGAAKADETFDCADGEDPDGGWSAAAGSDCSDEDGAVSARTSWYPDCDGDGVPRDTGTEACGASGADEAFDCADGENPDGGWSASEGTDCNDEYAPAAAEAPWYPDCDGDGVHSDTATVACGRAGANAGFACSDGQNPDGGWAGSAGSDCDDEDGSATAAVPWYPDCDDDGVRSNTATVACGASGADAAFDCADGQNPDGGWAGSAGSDCNDEDGSVTAAAGWYPDCDGDGVYDGAGTLACGPSGANVAFDCADGGDPDGGWSAAVGSDCNDEDATATGEAGWYPDCDGDGGHGGAGTLACGPSGANVAFDCADGGDPDGGWSAAAGSDCNDEDATATADAPWYPDCDDDGVHRNIATVACGASGADGAFDCSDGQNPDGGWAGSAGSDCNDEDGSVTAAAGWYPDCDGDGIHDGAGTLACGPSGADGAFDCADGGDPDGGWSAAAGSDCNDEDGAVSAVASWYPDCDNDGVRRGTATWACGAAEADAAFDCADGQNPDGGWSSTVGTDCNDEDGAAAVVSDWYPDCNDDGSFSPAATNACGVGGANAAYDCADGQDPDGGWSSSAGTDCVDDPTIDSACWYDPAWSYRRRITILKAQVVGTSAFFPVVIDKTLASWKSIARGGHVAQADGGDILFTDVDAETRLSHEVEAYDETTGWLVAWVKIPEVSSAQDSVIYAYYGNTEPALPDQEDYTAVWDDGGSGFFRGVWHMATDELGERYDSTVNDNGCDAVGYGGGENGVGLLGYADHLDGIDDWLDCGAAANHPSLIIRDAITMSAWMKQDFPRLGYEVWDTAMNKRCYGFYTYGANTEKTLTTLGVEFRIGGVSHDLFEYGTADLAPGVWNHIAVTYDGSYIKGYVNGALDFSVPQTGRMNECSTTWLEMSAASDPTNGAFGGTLDEVRLSATARSAGWIATSYHNQVDPDGFITVGSEAAQ